MTKSTTALLHDVDQVRPRTRSYDASQEIRNKHLTWEEGIALVRQFDGEMPNLYFRDVTDYIEMDMEEFPDLCERFRSPHLWEKVNGEWKLKYQVF